MALIRGEQITGSVALANLALTASYVPGMGDFTNKIVSGSIEAAVLNATDLFVIKSGSSVYYQIDNTGSAILTSDADTVFLIKGFGGNPILTVSQSGIVVFATHSTELTSSAPNGGIYFTSSSFFIGLD